MKKTYTEIIESYGVSVGSVIAVLDNVREEGSINMFGAGSILEDVFEFSRYDGRDVARAYTTGALHKEDAD